MLVEHSTTPRTPSGTQGTMGKKGCWREASRPFKKKFAALFLNFHILAQLTKPTRMDYCSVAAVSFTRAADGVDRHIVAPPTL